jgi:hypothetical protein
MKRALTICVAFFSSLLCAGEAPRPPITPGTVTPPELIESAKKEIARLTGDDFDSRNAAGDALKAMDITLLPWLRKHLEEQKFDAETRTTLLAVTKVLEEKNDAAILQYGTPVKLDLKDTTADDVFAAIQKQTGLAPIPGFDAAEKGKKPFAFDGPYWKAIAELSRVFPPKAPDPTTREAQPDVFFHGREQKPFDFFGAAAMGLGQAGISTLRVSRVAYEQEGAGRFLTLTLAPHIESRYVFKKLSAKVESLTLDDGRKLEPLQADLAIVDEHNYRGMDRGVVTAALKEKLAAAKSVSLTATLEFEVYEMKLVKQDLTKPGPYPLGGGVTLDVSDKESRTEGAGAGRGDRLVVKLSGAGSSSPRTLNSGQSFVLFNAEGEKIEFSNNGSSSRSGSGWSIEQTITVKGKPAAIEVQVPMLRPKVSIPVVIDRIPLPTAP